MTETSKNSRLSLILVLVVGLACVGLGALGLQRIRSKLAQAKPMQVLPLAVETILAASGMVQRTVPALATVKSAATVQIKAETGGRLLSMPLREGDAVKAGQVIGMIDSREQDAQLQAAQARNESAAGQVSATAAGMQVLTSQIEAARTNLEVWKGELKRDETLLQAGAIAQSAFENTRNRHAEAASRLATLQSQIESQKAQIEAILSQKKASAKDVKLWQVRRDYAELTSPIDGIVSARLQEEGNRVLPGVAVYAIEDTSKTRLIMQIPQDSATGIIPSQPVLLPGWEAAGFKITRIYPVQNDLRQVTVEAETERPCVGLRYDMQLPVRVVVAQAEGTVIPEAARFVDFHHPERFFVYIVRDGRAARTPMNAALQGDQGATLVDPAVLSPGTELAVGTYLENIRLPASFPVEVVQ